jgi:hypothetical protein
MHACGSLMHAENVYAYYSAASKHVVVAADVFLNPFTTEAFLCPNPIAMPIGAHELIVESVPRHLSGVHPQIEVKHRVTYAFASDATPKSVVVYSMGVDAPVRQEVPVGSTPPAPIASVSRPATTPSPAPAPAVAGLAANEVVGFSATYSFEEAIQDALSQAVAKHPSPPRNPDASVGIVVKTITARIDGNMRPGLYITATT